MRTSPLFASVAVVVIVVGGGCSTDPCALAPGYAGDATDEVYATLADARDRAAKDDEDRAVITAPKADARYDAMPKVEWTSTLQIASLSSAPGATGRGRSNIVDTLSQLLVPLVHAHLPPVTGDVYLVDVRDANKGCPVSVVTTELSVTFDDAGAAAIEQDVGPRTLTITSAYLESGRMTEGPFASAPIAFTLE